MWMGGVRQKMMMVRWIRSAYRRVSVCVYLQLCMGKYLLYVYGCMRESNTEMRGKKKDIQVGKDIGGR